MQHQEYSLRNLKYKIICHQIKERKRKEGNRKENNKIKGNKIRGKKEITENERKQMKRKDKIKNKSDISILIDLENLSTIFNE